MPEHNGSIMSFRPIEGLSIVTLKVARSSCDQAKSQMNLAARVSATAEDPRSLWQGPDRWLLTSETRSAQEMIGRCETSLAGIVHSAVDYSAALDGFHISGAGARTLLASGTGVDLRADHFPEGSCCRARFADIAAILVAEADSAFSIYVDRSYSRVICNWLEESLRIRQAYIG